MVIEKIEFENFRNIKNQTVFPTPGVNILWGQNAQGKTNALEAMYCFSTGKSFRAARDREMIRFDCESGGIRMKYRDARRENELSMKFFQDKNRRMEKNGVYIKKSSEFIGSFHSVLFCPEHLMLIKGEPQLRRSFLDTAISQLKPSYVTALSTYQRVLKQRNALLKDDFPLKNKAVIEVLTMQMANLNTHIITTRRQYLNLLSKHVDEFLGDMTGAKESVKLIYKCDVMKSAEEKEDFDAFQKDNYSELFYQRAMETLDRDIQAKTTLIGCHRDDVIVMLNDREAKKYASQGQDRSLALAMKLGEGELSRLAGGEYPVFLFDDVLSELDKKRQSYLMEQLKDRQVIMTCCYEEGFDTENVNLINVSDGTFDGE